MFPLFLIHLRLWPNLRNLTFLTTSLKRYFYNATFANLPLPDFPGAGVYHSSEIALVFGTYRLQANSTPFEAKLSAFMMNSWASFAKDPMKGPGWAELPTVMDFGAMGKVNTTITSAAIDQRCSVWDPVYDVIQ